MIEIIAPPLLDFSYSKSRSVARPDPHTPALYYAIFALVVWWLDSRWRRPRTASRQRVISIVQNGAGFPTIGQKQICCH